MKLTRQHTDQLGIRFRFILKQDPDGMPTSRAVEKHLNEVWEAKFIYKLGGTGPAVYEVHSVEDPMVLFTLTEPSHPEGVWYSGSCKLYMESISLSPIDLALELLSIRRR